MPRRRQTKPAPRPGKQRPRKGTDANKAVDLALARRIQDGDRRAVSELVHKYERFACKKALEAQARSGLELEDLCQEARMGLLKAAERYDPERGLAFTTYATWWVRHKLNRYVADHGCFIRIPVHAQSKVSQATKLDELENATGIVADALEALRVTAVPIDPSNEYGDTIVDVGDHDGGYNAEQALLSLIEQHRKAEWLHDMVQQLPEQERLILECRFFKYKTLVETAVWMHQRGVMKKKVTRERIRQIESKALERLRKRMLSDGNC